MKPNIVWTTYFFAILTTSVLSENLQKDKFCYGKVKKAHSNLQKLLNIGTNITKSSTYQTKFNLDNIKNLASEVVKIGNKLKRQNSWLDKHVDDLDRVFRDIEASSRKLNELVLPTENVGNPSGEVAEIVKMIQNKIGLFNNTVLENQKTSKTCSMANAQGLEFIKKANKLTEEFNDLRKNKTATNKKKSKIDKKLKKTWEKTKRINKRFDDLEIPLGVANDFLKSVNISTHLTNLERNKKMIESILKRLGPKISEGLIKRIQDLNSTINKLKIEGSTIAQLIDDYSKENPQAPELISDEIKSLIDQSRKKLEILEESLKNFDFPSLKDFLHNFERITKEVNEKIAEISEQEKKIKGYQVFSRVLLEILNKEQEIRDEVNRVKLSIKLINEKKKLEASLDEVKSIYAELIRHDKNEICIKNIHFEE